MKETIISNIKQWQSFFLNHSSCLYFYKEHWDEEYYRKSVLKQSKTFPSLKRSDLAKLSKEELINFGFIIYKDLILIPLWLVPILDQEQKYININNQEEFLKNQDLDVRGGCIALGLKLSELST